MKRLIGIKIQVLPDTQAEAVTVMERFNNIVTGLALEGIASTIQVTPYEHDPEDDL